MEVYNNTSINQLKTDSAPSVDWVKITELVLGVVGTIGNSIVCIIILTCKYMKTTTNYFIFSLAVADGFTSLLLILNRYLLAAITIEYPQSFAGMLYCRVWISQLLFWVGIKCSVFNLVAVTVERYFAIVHPFSYQQKFTKFTAVTMISITWFISFASELPFVFFHDIYLVEGVPTCQFSWPSSTASSIIGVTSFLTTYFFPILIMVWSYYKIVSSLRQNADRLAQNTNPEEYGPAKSLLKARQKVVRMLILVVMAFTICWSPNQCLFLAYNFGAPVVYSSIYYSFFVLLAFSNSVVNPVIYAFKYKQFRRGFFDIFCHRCHNRIGDESTIVITNT
ncbi:tachykinin-like peptides receptor 99D [Glandiceps talaboti]